MSNLAVLLSLYASTARADAPGNMVEPWGKSVSSTSSRSAV